MRDDWLLVWAALSDDSLEHRLRHYYWLSLSAPNLYTSRFSLLVAEAVRRGKPQIVVRAKEWVAEHGNLSPL
jgi:hypothetical protein